MVKDHHLQLRCHSLLFHNIKWFIIRVPVAHHPVIQREVLGKGTIEPATGGSGVYS